MTPGATDLFTEPGTLARPQRPASRWKVIAPLVLAGATFGTGAATVVNVEAAEAVVALQQHYLQVGTLSPSWVGAAQLAAYSSSDYGAMIRQLQQRSGLTWGELARALGVSRRAVHHWSAGKRPSERHARRVEDLAGLVARHPGTTSDAVRGLLLAPGIDGRSELTRFEEASQPRRSTALSTLSVADFFEGGELVEAPPVPPPVRSSSVKPRRLPERGEASTS